MQPPAAPADFVLVGVDGSPNADTALDWACTEALRRGVGLHVLHGMNLVGVMAVALIAVGSPEDDEVLVCAKERVLARAPSLTVTTVVSLLDARQALVEESAGAALLVVGARGENGTVSALLGSVSIHVSTRAHCPVVVVPLQSGGVDDHGVPHVVVGYDDSPASDAALFVAAHQALLLAAELRVVMAWTLETVDGVVVTTPGSPQWLELEGRQRQRMDAAIARLHVAAPQVADVAIRTRIVHGQPVGVLLEESRNAQLLVVGSRGRGGLRSLLLGSVSTALLERSRRPVVVTTRRPRNLQAVPVGPQLSVVKQVSEDSRRGSRI